MMKLIQNSLCIASVLYLASTPYLWILFGAVAFRYIIWIVPPVIVICFLALTIVKMKKGPEELPEKYFILASVFFVVWILGVNGVMFRGY